MVDNSNMPHPKCLGSQKNPGTEPKTCERGPKLGFEYLPTSKTSHCVRTACMAFPLSQQCHGLVALQFWWMLMCMSVNRLLKSGALWERLAMGRPMHSIVLATCDGCAFMMHIFGVGFAAKTYTCQCPCKEWSCPLSPVHQTPPIRFFGALLTPPPQLKIHCPQYSW